MGSKRTLPWTSKSVTLTYWAYCTATCSSCTLLSACHGTSSALRRFLPGTRSAIKVPFHRDSSMWQVPYHSNISTNCVGHKVLARLSTVCAAQARQKKCFCAVLAGTWGTPIDSTDRSGTASPMRYGNTEPSCHVMPTSAVCSFFFCLSPLSQDRKLQKKYHLQVAHPRRGVSAEQRRLTKHAQSALKAQCNELGQALVAPTDGIVVSGFGYRRTPNGGQK